MNYCCKIESLLKSNSILVKKYRESGQVNGKTKHCLMTEGSIKNSITMAHRHRVSSQIYGKS